MVYSLIFTDLDLSYDGFKEYFMIGVFDSNQKAQVTAEYYLENVEGFNKYPCKYRIETTMVKNLTPNRNFLDIWVVYGWNVNCYSDEIDIVTSLYVLTEEEANIELKAMQHLYNRSEWDVNCYKLNELNWIEGFTRC